MTKLNITNLVTKEVNITGNSLMEPTPVLQVYILFETRDINKVLRKRKEILDLKTCIYKGKEYEIIGTEHVNKGDHISHIGVLLNE